MNPNQPDPATANSVNPVQPKKKSLSAVIILCIVLDLLLIGGAGAFAFQQYDKSKKADAKVSDLNKQVSTLTTEKKKLSEEVEKRAVTTGEENIDKSGFQSVFLKDGQVYFGKITKLTETQLTLTNIYYLRSNSTSGGTSTTKDPNNISGDVSLTKLGNELHGPQDTMYIERKEVNFWENLKNDGQVAKAIAEYEKQNKN